MTAWIDAFLPTLALIALGFGLRPRFLPDVAVWSGIERLIFWLLLPALLCAAISTIDLGSLPLGKLAVAIGLPLVGGTALAVGLARALGHQAAATTSVLQGGIRFNNFIAFSVAGGLLGTPGLAFGGVAAGIMVITVQVTLTVAFALAGGRRLKPLRFAREIVLNPLIVGCVAGGVFAAFGGMPHGIGPLVRQLGQASVALGLLCVGAALRPGDLRDLPLTQVLTGVQKLALMPVATFVACRLMSLDPLPSAVATLFMAMPTAPSSYVMARSMGGDPRLMAAIITLQHLAAVITLPLWALFLTT